MKVVEGDAHPRGVFTGPFSAPGGNEMLIAVDTEGQVVAQIVVKNEQNRDALLAAAWNVLTLTDPRSSLRLMH